MNRKAIYITAFDLKRLRNEIESYRTYGNEAYWKYAEQLQRELENAIVLESRDLPVDVISMNAQVRMEDLETGQTMDYTLVFPSMSDAKEKKISVLAPVGTAMLGARVGDVIEWPVPKGIRRLAVREILYQPEAAGHFHL